MVAAQALCIQMLLRRRYFFRLMRALQSTLFSHIRFSILLDSIRQSRPRRYFIATALFCLLFGRFACRDGSSGGVKGLGNRFVGEAGREPCPSRCPFKLLSLSAEYTEYGCSISRHCVEGARFFSKWGIE